MIVGLNIFRFCMRAKLRARQKCNTNSSPECSHRQKRHRASLRRALFLLSPMFLRAIVPSPEMNSHWYFNFKPYISSPIFSFHNWFLLRLSELCWRYKERSEGGSCYVLVGRDQRSVGIGVWNPGTQRSVRPGDLHYRFSSVELYSKYTKPNHPYQTMDVVLQSKWNYLVTKKFLDHGRVSWHLM